MVLFLKVFLTEFIAEMGDKTQLMLIALTSKYKLKDIILGTAAGLRRLQHSHFFTSQHPPFPVMMTRKQEEGGKSKIRFAPLAVFCTFFVAELGDKTRHMGCLPFVNHLYQGLQMKGWDRQRLFLLLYVSVFLIYYYGYGKILLWRKICLQLIKMVFPIRRQGNGVWGEHL